jgi:uncharacterized protein YqeY
MWRKRFCAWPWASTTDPEKRAVLAQEMQILATYLPKSLSVDEIVSALAPVAAQIKAAGNDGQATGIAMKQLKSEGLVVNGKDVTLAIKELRKAE